MQSKKRIPNEILASMRALEDRCPVILVPTMGYTTPTDVFRDTGFSMVIWINCSMRAAVAGMREVARRIYKSGIYKKGSLLGVETTLPPVDAFLVVDPTLVHDRIEPGSLDQLGSTTVSPKATARQSRRFLTGEYG